MKKFVEKRCTATVWKYLFSAGHVVEVLQGSGDCPVVRDTRSFREHLGNSGSETSLHSLVSIRTPEAELQIRVLRRTSTSPRGRKEKEMKKGCELYSTAFLFGKFLIYLRMFLIFPIRGEAFGSGL